MKTKLSSVLLVIFCTFLTSIAQLLFKFGAERLPEIITNWQLILGFFLYALAAAVLIVALKGGDVSVLFPIIATSYIWVAMLSSHYLDETIGLLKLFGILLIIIGITSIGYASKKNSALEYTEVP